MITKQQQEALDYFSSHAGNWRAKAEDAGKLAVNVIEQRNYYVLQAAAERQPMRSFLDVGCGTGELVCEMAARGVDSKGVDYAPEMIDLATKKALDAKLSNAKFEASSIFDFDMSGGNFDLISANGFIEYISLQEMQTFFGLVAKALAPGGSFVVGSRNRLFNLVTMNEYTLQEMASGSSELLLKEAVKWTGASGMPEVSAEEAAPLQAPEIEHAKTGIDVATRFQYSPFQLINLLQQSGLRPVEVYPIHVHGAPPAFAHAHPETHASVASLLQSFARHNTQLLPNASSFMLHVKKGE